MPDREIRDQEYNGVKEAEYDYRRGNCTNVSTAEIAVSGKDHSERDEQGKIMDQYSDNELQAFDAEYEICDGNNDAEQKYQCECAEINKGRRIAGRCGKEVKDREYKNGQRTGRHYEIFDFLHCVSFRYGRAPIRG